MDSLGIEYTICKDVDKMEKLGIMTVPTLEIEEEMFDSSMFTTLLDFSQAVKWLKEYEKNEH